MNPDSLNTNPQASDEEERIRRAFAQADAELSAKRAPSDQATLAAGRSPLKPDFIEDIETAVGTGIAKAAFETKDFLFGEPAEADKSNFRRSLEAQGRAVAAQGVAYGLTQGVSQFVTGLIGASKVLAPVKAVQRLRAAGKTGRTAYEIGRGATAGAVVIDPHEERLSNLIEEFPALQNPVSDYLAADFMDSAAEGRLKNALEGIGLDLAIVGTLGLALKAIRHLRGGEADKAARELAKLEQARKANKDAFGLDFAERPKADPTAGAETATGARTEAQASEGTTAPPEAPTPSSGAPGVKQGNELGGDIPDPIPNPSVPPKAAPIEVTPDAMADILRATDAELATIKRFGSREAAAEAGQLATRESRLPWQKLRTAPEVRAFLSSAADTLKAHMDARKGGDILADAEVNAKVRAIAEYYGEAPDVALGELVQAGADAGGMVAKMEAAYLITNRMFDETYSVAFKLRNGMLEEWGGSATRAGEELKARLQVATELLAAAKSVSSNSGRALRRMRGQHQFKAEDLEAIKGLDPERLADLLYSTKGDPQKLAQIANPGFLRRVMNEATFSLTNSLLWLYPTHIVNTASNLYMLAGRPTEKLLGSFAIAPKAGGDLLRQQAIREYSATVAALGDAWEAMVEAFKRGDSILSPHNTEFFQGGTTGITQQPLPWKPVRSITDLAENGWKAANYRNIVGLPTRALGAVDEFFKTLRYRAYVQAEAATRANRAGLTGEDFRQFVAGEMEKAIDPATGRATNSKALLEAQTTTFQNELLAGTAGATIQQARNRHPILTFVLPFVKTPVNVLRYSWRMTPGLSALQKDYRAAISGKQGAEAQAHAIGQFALGSTFMGLAAILAMNGKMTGGGPRDPKLQQQLRATGWQPYAYVIEDGKGGRRFVPMGRFDPAGMALGAVADLVDMQRLDPDSHEPRVGMGALALALAKSFTGRTFLQNANQALQALSDPGARGEKWAGQIAANTIPLSSLLRGTNPDPYLRDARGFLDTMMKGLPGYSESLPPSRDVFGEPIWRRIGITSEDEADEVEAEHNRIMLETGSGLSRPDPAFEGVDLRDIKLPSGQTAYDRLEELAGKLPKGPSLKEALTALIRSETYQDLADGDGEVKGTRLRAIADIVTKYRQAARKVLIQENRETLAPLIKARQQDARAAYLKNREARREGQPGAQAIIDAFGSR